MDEELKAYLDSMRAENAAAHVETRRYAEQLISETRTDFGAVWERFESKIELVAEGVLGANERIDRLDAKVDGLEAKVDRLETRVDHLDTKVDRLETKVDHLAGEMRSGFAGVRSLITSLDRRVTTLEQH